ncbi:hypothetical protein AB6A40_011352 [Gnathostoma spinigerum]|uniref:Hexosyltransferase n=1 Tax=Gnathostoma spinigerum TaxID=75299 RepID=A0ABD6F3D5_9BILA
MLQDHKWFIAVLLVGSTFYIYNAFYRRKRISTPVQINMRYPIHSLSDLNLPLADQPKNLTYLPIVRTNRQLCGQKSLNLLFVVHSHWQNVGLRRKMRGRFRKLKLLTKKRTAALFVMGCPREQYQLQTLMAEHKTYNDIHIVNITESYHNISLKARSWIYYVNSTCGNRIQYIVKLDDDVVFNPNLLLALVERLTQEKNFVACRTFVAGVVTRNVNSKW